MEFLPLEYVTVVIIVCGIIGTAIIGRRWYCSIPHKLTDVLLDAIGWIFLFISIGSFATRLEFSTRKWILEASLPLLMTFGLVYFCSFLRRNKI